MTEDQLPDPQDVLQCSLDDPEACDEWIRARIGRRALIACAPDIPSTLTDRLGRCQELRVAPLPSAAPSDTAREAALTDVLRSDPHVLLLWVDEPSSGERDALARRLNLVCERAGALDLCFVALLGPGMTRALARSYLFEDGFDPTVDESALLRAILLQAAAREQARRNGSSMPCYL